MILVIDNYDSFAHNLARYVGLAGQDYAVVRNNEVSIEEIQREAFSAVILSPGPCTPKEAGISVEVVKQLGPDTPILGVCLGHQCIGEAYGTMTLRAQKPYHAKECKLHHDGTGLFENIPSPTIVARYHSLIVQPTSNSPLEILAHSEDGEIMAMRHKKHPVYGVQFHPESILTEQGLTYIQNFIKIVHAHNQAAKLHNYIAA